MLYQAWWLPYQYLFDELNWTIVDMANMSNFEPRCLETLIRNHLPEVQDAYEEAIRDCAEDPGLFMLKMNPWDLLGSSK